MGNCCDAFGKYGIYFTIVYCKRNFKRVDEGINNPTFLNIGQRTKRWELERAYDIRTHLKEINILNCSQSCTMQQSTRALPLYQLYDEKIIWEYIPITLEFANQDS